MALLLISSYKHSDMRKPYFFIFGNNVSFTLKIPNNQVRKK